MIRVDDPSMRNPIASILSEMVRLSHMDSIIDYDFIINSALNYGYEVKYSDLWQGNIPIRSALNGVALICHAASHRIFASKVLELWNDIAKVNDKEPWSWYTHDLRVLLQNLLANDQCADDASERLAAKLVRLNELTH
jgi:hypothetical protein